MQRGPDLQISSAGGFRQKNTVKVFELKPLSRNKKLKCNTDFLLICLLKASVTILLDENCIFPPFHLNICQTVALIIARSLKITSLPSETVIWTWPYFKNNDQIFINQDSIKMLSANMSYSQPCLKVVMIAFRSNNRLICCQSGYS